MKRLRIVVLGVVFAIGFACMAAFLLATQLSVTQFVGSNPDKAQAIGPALLDYTLPAGYQEHGGRDVGLVKMVLITPEGQATPIDAGQVIVLTAVSSLFGLSEEKLQDELRLALLRSNSAVTTMERVGEQTTQVKGAAVTLTTYESFAEYDTPVRIVISTPFMGKSENVIFLVVGPIDAWDQRMVEHFIGSIK